MCDPSDFRPCPHEDPEAEPQRHFARSLRAYVQDGFPNQERFLEATCINRGHFNAMIKGDVDPKLTMLYRMTREVGRCPVQLLCEPCARKYGRCVVRNAGSAPSDGAAPSCDLREHLRRFRQGPHPK